MSRQDNMRAMLAQARACQHCRLHLPTDPRPVVRAHADARVLIIGQAPGIKVHETGVPWNDASGNRLRKWMQTDREEFYDERRFAIMPMGFCYPGKGKSGDLPPRPECAPLWHAKFLELLPEVRLTLLIGRFAQNYYLGDRAKKNLTSTVRAYREYLPRFLPLAHPSPRNQLWLKKNPWFESEVVPELRNRLQQQ